MIGTDTKASVSILVGLSGLVTALVSIGIGVGVYERAQVDHDRRIVYLEARDNLRQKEREELVELKVEVRHLRDGVASIQKDVRRLITTTEQRQQK